MKFTIPELCLCDTGRPIQTNFSKDQCVIHSQGELTRVNAQLEEVKSTYESEVARLRNKLQDTMDELVSVLTIVKKIT